MTREELKERIPVMLAWCDGKKIEWRYIDRNVIENQGWVSVMDEEPDFLNNVYNHLREYRIKPEPREWSACMQCYRLQGHGLHGKCTSCGNSPVIRVREVL